MLRLKKFSDTIALGKIDTSIETSLLERKDEIGDLAKAFENMKIQIRDYIIEINTTNDRLKADKKKLKETNDKLNNALIKASESEKLTQSFLANISHEIRTPMNSIVGFSQLLEECGANSDEYIQYVNLVTKGSEQLLTILDSIINLSKIESGIMKPQWEPINIDTLLKEKYELFYITAQNEGLELILNENGQKQKVNIVSDIAFVHQILNNLITNAIKYTPKGTITLGSIINDNYITFYIQDTGIGIPEEDQQIIFEPFRQIHQQNPSVKKSGAGLGLALVNKITSILNGDIKLESKINIGSTFYIKLPIKPK